MEIKNGFIKEVLPERNGTSTNGNSWRMQDVVIGYGSAQFPHSVVASVSGDNIEKFGLHRGSKGRFLVDGEAREYQGKWFNSLRLWSYEPSNGQSNEQNGGAQPSTDANGQAAQPVATAQPIGAKAAEGDDLPF